MPSSPFVQVFQELRAIDALWQITIGRPHDEPGWIDGLELASPGTLQRVLDAHGRHHRTTHKLTVAALFALNYGWSAGIAIAPYITHRCVPDVRLENLSLKFRANGFFVTAAVHEPTGIVVGQQPSQSYPGIEAVPDDAHLLSALRTMLYGQTQPVVAALHISTGFSTRAIWGLVASAWATQFVNVYSRVGPEAPALATMSEFFRGDDLLAAMQPRSYSLTIHSVTRVYHRRASCCRYYLTPGGTLCASCPLVSDEERLQRNYDWAQMSLRKQ